MANDHLKLARIIQSSARVQKIRKAVGLKKGEFIRQMTSDWIEIYKTTNKKLAKPGRRIETIDGTDARRYVLLHAYPYIEKEVVDYFGLPKNMTKLAEDCILHGKVPSEDFTFLYQLDERTGKMNIKITLNNTLTSYSRDDLFRRIDDANFLIEEFHRTKNTQGLGTQKSSHHQIRATKNFDEKFTLLNRYNDLRSEYPTQMPKKEQDRLRKVGKIVFGENIEGYTIDDFRKNISEFKKYFSGD